MTTTLERFRAGDLAGAIEDATARVRKQPASVDARVELCQLLCFEGDLERIDRQLAALEGLEPASALGFVLFRRLLRAEQARRDCFAEGRLPELTGPVGEPSPSVKERLRSGVLLRAGEMKAAADVLAALDGQEPPIRARWNGHEVADVRDMDDRFGPVLEVLSADGRYFWIPLDTVDRVVLPHAGSVRDQVFRPATLTFRNGATANVFLPALYPGTHEEAETALRLGRATEWRGGDGSPVRGVGLKMFMAGDAARTIHELERLERAGEETDAEGVSDAGA